MRSVVICSIGVGPHEELLAIGRPMLEDWATRFGYDLDLRTEPLAPERPAAWSKIVVMRERLETHRVAVWVDADAVVVDGRQDVGNLVSRSKPLAMVAHTYGQQTVPNLGFFAMRSTRRTKALLDTLWSMTEYLDHKWWENAALLDLLGYDISSEPISKVHQSPLDKRINWLGNEWNSISLDPATSPIIVHFPGQTNEERKRLMTGDASAWQAQRQSSTS